MRLVALFLVVVTACASSANGSGGAADPSRTARCGAEGHPPYRAEPGSTRVVGQGNDCPRVEPTNGSSCPESALVWTDTSAGRQRSGPMCLYVAPQRGPCEFDSCACELWHGNDKPPTWSCGAAME